MFSVIVKFHLRIALSEKYNWHHIALSISLPSTWNQRLRNTMSTLSKPYHRDSPTLMFPFPFLWFIPGGTAVQRDCIIKAVESREFAQ